MSATIAVVLPTPPSNGIGRRKPKTAKLGTVCTTFTTPSVQRRSRARRTRITADGAAITTATNTEIATSHNPFAPAAAPRPPPRDHGRGGADPHRNEHGDRGEPQPVRAPKRRQPAFGANG